MKSSESVAWLVSIISWLRKITQNQSFFHMVFSSDRPDVSDFLQDENLYFFLKFYHFSHIFCRSIFDVQCSVSYCCMAK